MFRNSQTIILTCVYRSNISIKWLQEILQQLDGDDNGECAMKIVLVAWVGHRSGVQKLTRSVFPVSLLYCTLEKFDDAFNFLLTSRCCCCCILHINRSGLNHTQ